MEPARLFECLPTFLCRTPALPMDLLPSILVDPEAWCDSILLSGNPLETRTGFLLWEAVQIASPSLASAWSAYLDGKTLEPKRHRALRNALIKYAIRACYRPTPFGTFAGVDLVSLGEGISRSRTERFAMARPTYSYMKQTAADNSANERRHALYSRAPSLQLISDRYYFFVREQRPRSIECHFTLKSISAPQPVRTLISFLDTPKTYGDLLRLMSHQYPNVDQPHLDRLLQQAEEARVILRRETAGLTLPSSQPYAVIINMQCGSSRPTTIELARSAFGSGVPIDTGRAVLPPDNQHESGGADIQVEMCIPTLDAFPDSLLSKVSRAAETLTMLSTLPLVSPALEQFTEEFMERFGIYQRVPLTYALSEFSGMGAPSGYLHPPRSTAWPARSPAHDSTRRDKKLQEIVLEAVRSHSMTYALTEEEFEELSFVKLDADQVCNSMDLFCSLRYKSWDQLLLGDFQVVVGPMGGSVHAGRTLGRFCELLGPAALEHLSEVSCRADEECVLHAELVYAPMIDAASAPARRLHAFNHEICLDTGTPSVPLSNCIWEHDLSVYVDQDMQLHLYSERHGVIVVPHSTNQLNTSIASNTARFIDELSCSYIRKPGPFSWGKSEGSAFLPRLIFEDIVISVERWLFTPKAKTQTKDEFMQQLSLFTAKWHVPSRVMYRLGDQLLPLDLSTEWGRDTIWAEVDAGKTNTVVLQGDPWADSQGDDRITPDTREYVFSCVKAVHDRANTSTTTSGIYSLPTSSFMAFPPQSSWVFLKLYASESTLPQVLNEMASHLHEFYQASPLWYFVRYRDPDPHLRVRLKLSAPVNLEVFYERINHAVTSDLETPRLVWKVEVDTYRPEVARYGGEDCIEIVETLFASDSRRACAFLAESDSARVETLLHFTAKRFLQYAKSFADAGVDLPELFARPERRDPANRMTSEHRELYRFLFREFQQGGLDSSLGLLEDSLVRDLVYILLRKNRRRHLGYVFQSLIHMCSNRLLGIDPATEQVVVETVGRFVHSPATKRLWVSQASSTNL